MVQCIRSDCGSKRLGTGFESRSGRMFVIEVVHIVLQTVQRTGVLSAVFDTLHFGIKTFDNDSTVQSSDFFLSRIAT